MKKILLSSVVLMSLTTNVFSCLIPSYTAVYNFSGEATGRSTVQLSGENGGYSYSSITNAKKLFFKGKFIKNSQGKVIESGFYTSKYQVNEGFNNVSYSVEFDNVKNRITSTQGNKKFHIPFPKDKKIIGKLIFTSQLQLMLIRDSSLKQVTINAAFHKKDAKMEFITLEFNIKNDEKINTPLGEFNTKVFSANYKFERNDMQIRYWFTDDDRKLLVRSEIYVNGKVAEKNDIVSYQIGKTCVVEN